MHLLLGVLENLANILRHSFLNAVPRVRLRSTGPVRFRWQLFWTRRMNWPNILSASARPFSSFCPSSLGNKVADEAPGNAVDPEAFNGFFYLSLRWSDLPKPESGLRGGNPARR